MLFLGVFLGIVPWMSRKKRHAHEIKAYAAFTDRGYILYDTIKPTKQEAAAVLQRLNPSVAGHYYPFAVHPVYIGIDSGFQLDIEDAITAAARKQQ